MARTESARDDLFAELKSYGVRWEFHVPQEPLPVVLALRNDGRLAIYLGDDPCFHFDGDGRLLRAFVNGKLYRTQGTSLACLVRQRSESETALVRRDLNGNELEKFLLEASRRLQTFVTTLLQGNARITRALTNSEFPLSGAALHLDNCSRHIQLAPAYPTRQR